MGEQPGPSTASTAEIVALHGLGRSIDARFVKWAGQMLVEGHDTPSLRVLALESAPFNYFEMAGLVDRVFEELELQPHPTQEEAARALAVVRVQQALAGERTRNEVLEELDELYLELGHPWDLKDFSHLHCARVDLETEEMQRYWPGADRGNIDAIIDAQFRTWLEELDTD